MFSHLPKVSQGIFWAPCNKMSRSLEVALVDFSPDGHPWVYTSNRFEKMGTETQLLCTVYTNSRYIFFSPRKFCCLFSLESIWNVLRWLLTIVQFCGMSLTRHNNPLRIVKSNRRDGGPFFPKSCCRYCEKVYHFSIGVYWVRDRPLCWKQIRIHVRSTQHIGS